MATKFYIDLHCHSSMKPYGKSYENNFVHSPVSTDKNSIYYYDPPTVKDKILNISSTLSKFSQSNLTALKKGSVKVICASLYPTEKGFFSGKTGTGTVTDVASDFVTGIGKERINFIQSNNDYFADLNKEYEFYRQLHGLQVSAGDESIQYFLTKNVDELKQNINNSDRTIISVILTIEGFHSLNSHADKRAEVYEIMDNLEQLKNLEFRPLFISPGHHFYNEMCGHAYSLSGLPGKILDQRYGADTGISSLGFEVIDALLDNSGNKRIHIDIKHMSVESRRQYYRYLQDKPEIPVIVSHGAVNGFESFENRRITSHNGKNIFYQGDINIFDHEILKISRSKGIFCLQLDERRVAHKSLLKKSFLNLNKKNMLMGRSELVWNQVRHIGEILDRNGSDAWNITALGSDFDGIVDPINGFWTAEELPLLEQYLLIHAKKYLATEGKNMQLPQNKNKDAEEIITNIFSDNAMKFLELYFR